jgi:hypothetical protein
MLWLRICDLCVFKHHKVHPLVYPSLQRSLSFWLDKQVHDKALRTRWTNKKLQTVVGELFRNAKHGQGTQRDNRGPTFCFCFSMHSSFVRFPVLAYA